MRAQFRSRLRLVLAAVLVMTALVVIRLYFVQIVHGEAYALKAEHQSTASGGLFDRGTIYFTTKGGTLVSAATLETGYLVAINPQLAKDLGAAYDAVAAIATTTMSKPTFLSIAGNPGQVYVEVAHHLSDAEGAALSAKKIAGIEVLRERWRYYPGGPLAAESIGLVSYGAGGDTLTGQTGLEAQYDTTLSRSGDSLYQNFFAELFSGAGNILASAKDAHEGNLVTTIEPEVETRLSADLAKVNAKYHSSGTGGIIIDPHTGAIIALASAPTFDPNDTTNLDPSLLRNPLVENVYEFGSTMKALTMVSALDAGVVTPATTYDDTGCITVNTAKVCNFDHRARGVVPMVQVIEQSLNVGASWVATQLGQPLFRKYFESFFGTKTGIDLPGEQAGLIGNLNTSEQVNFDNMSFGQGIAVTPVAMMRALASIANGGIMETPHLVSSILLDTGIEKPIDWGKGAKRVFSPEAASEVGEMLETVYPNDAKLALNADPSLAYADVPVAAKTGTAQVEMPGGGYYTDVFFHSFFGFFPANTPRFAILLYTNRPQGVEYASGTLTPTFMDLTNFLINYYNIPPDPKDVIPLPARVTE